MTPTAEPEPPRPAPPRSGLKACPRRPESVRLTRRRGGRAGAWLAIPLLVIPLLAIGLALGGCDSAQRTTPAPSGPVIGAPGQPVDYGAIPPGGQFEAVVGRVHDGDSFDLKADRGQRIGVRISGIDAPERRQPYSDLSRRQLQALIGGQTIRVHVLGRDRYGRILGRVERPARPGDPAAAAVTDVGLAQIEAGLAWYYRRYERDLPPAWRSRYDAAESAARSEGRGLWREPEPVEPWRFREDRRGGSPSGPAPSRLSPWSQSRLTWPRWRTVS